MSELDKHITIPKNVASNDDLDYAFLKQKGLEYIEQFSSSIWTDYNSHDPGITILEMLCYAITDLSQRIELPIENILAPESSSDSDIESQFFKASTILSSKPVTGNDYRKLFIDIEGVKNCWLKAYSKTVYVNCADGKLSFKKSDFNAIDPLHKKEFQLKGLYHITVDFDEGLSGIEVSNIKEQITQCYHANRNLCEDLVAISQVESFPVAVCASIDLKPEADEELVHANVLDVIENYFSPSIKFYSLKQLFDKGYTSDEIFEGPLLQNGFIDPEELENAKLRTEIRLSDLINLIMDVDGVELIKDISISGCDDVANSVDKWLLCVDEGKKPILCSKSAFSYHKGVLPVNLNKSKVIEYSAKIKQAKIDEHKQASIGMDIAITKGKFLNTSVTTTIQNDFPETFGVTEVGLPGKSTVSHKAKVKQLQGYLLFFDQVLASYFMHLGKVKDLLSVNTVLRQTYFTQAISDVKGFDELIKNYPKADPEELTKKLLGDLDKNIERKNRLLDHMIARFAETFSNFTFLMQELYGNYASEAILKSKESFLSDYHTTSSERGAAFNYYKQPASALWNTSNVSGVQKRIARLSGMKNYSRRNLSNSFVQIYKLTNSNGDEVFRWRIRNNKNQIILSATENYLTQSLAEDELYLATVRLIETTVEEIENAFLKPIKDGTLIGNLLVQKSVSKKFSFDVINPDIEDLSSSKRIIARHYTLHQSANELKMTMLGIINFLVNNFTEEGMFLIEHSLLLPSLLGTSVHSDQFYPIAPNNCSSCQPIDPYSYRVTVILPGWTYRFANSDFRNFMETLIRKELPAHVLARICWIGYRMNNVDNAENDMFIFEREWKKFLKLKSDEIYIKNNDQLTVINHTISQLSSIYPTGRLIDCDDESDSLENKIILGRTYIGNL